MVIEGGGSTDYSTSELKEIIIDLDILQFIIFNANCQILCVQVFMKFAFFGECPNFVGASGCC